MLFERGEGKKNIIKTKIFIGFFFGFGGGGLEAFKNDAFAGLRIPRDLNVVLSVRETVAHGAFAEIFPSDVIRVGDGIGEGIGEAVPDFFKWFFAVFVPRRAPLAVAQGIHLLRKALSLLS